MRDGFVWMGFMPKVFWMPESQLKNYRTYEDVHLHDMNVGDQVLEMKGDQLMLITFTNKYAHCLTYTEEKIILVKGK